MPSSYNSRPPRGRASPQDGKRARCHAHILAGAVAVLVAGLTSVSARAADATDPPSTAQPLDDPWWTGSLLASGAATLPRGHALVEPYVYDFHSIGRFDDKGNRETVAADDTFGSQTYLLYGVTDHFTAGVIPHFGYRHLSTGSTSSSIQAGDLTLHAQYLINSYRTGSWAPTLSFVLQESLPIGRYEKLDAKPLDGFGTGAFATSVALYSQTYARMPNGRLLRARLDLSTTLPTGTSVHGASVYGTPTGFVGRMRSNSAFSVDLGLEYSASRHWALALDVGLEHDGETHVRGVATGDNSIYQSTVRSSDALILAPALEYNFTSRLGVISGVRLVPAGRNAASTIAPVIALNVVL